jgi:hypothetical protein
MPAIRDHQRFQSGGLSDGLFFSAGPRALEPKHRTLATPSARPGRVQTPWTSSNTAAPANTITDVAAAPVKKPTAQSSARSRN